MQSFVQVVDAGSFSAAAERLHVSKSLLSKNVSRLERHLGTQLLVRTTRRLNPTDAGASLFQKCERLFNDLEEAEQAVLSLDVKPRGHLRVVCTDVLGEQYVSRVAAAMCALHPQLKSMCTSRCVPWISLPKAMILRSGTESSTIPR